MSDTTSESKLVQILGDHKLLIEFYWDCGRQGDLSGMFITTRAELDKIVGKEVYFGEVLGKHSEVYGKIEADDFTVLTDDQDFLKKFIEILGEGTINGYNPFDYWDADEVAEEDDDE